MKCFVYFVSFFDQPKFVIKKCFIKVLEYLKLNEYKRFLSISKYIIHNLSPFSLFILQALRIASHNFQSVTFVYLVPVHRFYLCIFDYSGPHTITLVINSQVAFNVAFALVNWLLIHYSQDSLKGLILYRGDIKGNFIELLHDRINAVLRDPMLFGKFIQSLFEGLSYLDVSVQSNSLWVSLCHICLLFFTKRL